MKGGGNSLDFGNRIYDSRLGRWLSTDPLQKKYPSFSPYNNCLNNPVLNVDFDGRKVYVYNFSPDFSLYGFLGHTALGQGIDPSNITYEPFSGHTAQYFEHEEPCYPGSVSCFNTVRTINELGTLKLYMDNGDAILRANINFSEDIEESIGSTLKDLQKFDNTKGQWWIFHSN